MFKTTCISSINTCINETQIRYFYPLMKKDSHILVRVSRQTRDDYKKSVRDMSEDLRRHIDKMIKKGNKK